MPDDKLLFGFPEEWADFQRRHTRFLERFPDLMATYTAAFDRPFAASEIIDKFVFMYGKLCWEAFAEVLLCCGNGYGIAALKLLRTLYEQTVTLRYLHEHPDQLSAFMDFLHVSEYKLLISIDETLGREASDGKRKEIEDKYSEVKEQFRIPLCKKCKTTKINYTWTTLNFPAMARQCGAVGNFVAPAYFVPLQQAHATMSALLSRLRDSENESESDTIYFDHTAQRKHSDFALRAAHNVVLDIFRVQDERFHPWGLAEKILHCFNDFPKMYEARAPETT